MPIISLYNTELVTIFLITTNTINDIKYLQKSGHVHRASNTNIFLKAFLFFKIRLFLLFVLLPNKTVDD